jgi:hypothetical protein
LFFKAQRHEVKPSAGDLPRDLEMVAAILKRAHRRLAGAGVAELDGQPCEGARRQIDRLEKQLRPIDEKLQPEQEPHVEPSAKHHDSGTERAASEQARDCAGVEDLPVAVRRVLRSNSTAVPELNRAEKAEPYRQRILALFGTCKGNSCESTRNWRLPARSCRMPP